MSQPAPQAGARPFLSLLNRSPISLGVMTTLFFVNSAIVDARVLTRACAGLVGLSTVGVL